MKTRRIIAASAAALAATLALSLGAPTPGAGIVQATQPTGCC